ncbi:thymic stromal lymphopoietin [Onychomys torridus]|uniref:thymic stromal lymphopoietin n=1 Tax=Onychomys torridus TaxID=38674 RepID=UPI00167FC079|nr:thymic stromal lymphopoietin [Onychomys torridus]
MPEAIQSFPSWLREWVGREPELLQIAGQKPCLLQENTFNQTETCDNSETSGLPEQGCSQSRTPLLLLKGESCRNPLQPRGIKGQWETRRNEVETAPGVPGHLLSAQALDNYFGGWAEPAGVEALPTDCLMKIEYHTLNPIPGCPSLPKKTFALRTKEALINQCPGYSETQRNNPQEMKQEDKNICLNQTSQIQCLWFIFRQTL